jgi:predicted nucleic acid-binding protein
VPDPVYFDSSVFLAIFMAEASGPNIKELLKELKRDKVRIYTSIVTIQEVSVQTFRMGAIAADNYTKVNKLARIYGINKEIALTAAKLEAQVLDAMKARDREENKQRKWDCFHLATAMELGCRTFYALDEKLLRRGRQFCLGTGFAKPAPRALVLPLFPEPESESKIDAKESAQTKPEPAGKEQPDAAATVAQRDKLQADPAHPAPVQGSDGGRAQGEAAGEAESKKQTPP